MKKTVTLLKITGLITSILGFFCYLATIVSRTVAYTAFIVETKIAEAGEVVVPSKDITTAINNYFHSVFWLLLITMAIILVYELVNYILYLKKAKTGLVVAVIIEIIACGILTVLRQNGIVHFQTLALLIPIITGLTNYLILIIDKK